jgi:uncharacterized protein YggE
MAINTGGLAPVPRPMAAARAAAAPAEVAPPTFEPGTTMVQVSVNGTVEID